MKAIRTLDLTKRFKNKTAVDALNLEVEEGELFSLLGVNGAGKTTTIKMLSCLLKPDAGDALVCGKSIVSNPMEVKSVINVSPQESAVAPKLSVRENLEFAAGVYGYPKSDARKRAGEFMESFGLSEAEGQRAGTLSGGQQRRLSIAMSLISEPRVLFLDEPTLGLDVLARRELWRTIEQLKGRMTVILTTHYMEEAEALSDRVAIMEKGALKAVGTVPELVSLSGGQNLEEAFVKLAGGER